MYSLESNLPTIPSTKEVFRQLSKFIDLPVVSLASMTNTGRNFPPYDIIEFEDGSIRLDMAVAGFTKDRLSVEMEENTLIIRGFAQDKNETNLGKKIRNGISNASWVRTFQMSPHTKIDTVELQNGILSITISIEKTEVPKKTFEIK